MKTTCHFLIILLLFVVSAKSDCKFDDWSSRFQTSEFSSSPLNALSQARNKANVHFGHKSATIREAITIIHLYTQPTKLHSEMNKFLRGARQDSNNVLDDYKSCLLEAIDNLCEDSQERENCVRHPILFHGQTYEIDVKQGGTHKYAAFTSASKKISKGIQFALSDDNGVPVLVKMTNVRGIYVEKYTAVPYEYEVIINPSSQYSVDGVFKTSTEIRQKVIENNGYYNSKLRYFIEMTFTGHDTSGSMSQTVKGSGLYMPTFAFLLLFGYSNI